MKGTGWLLALTAVLLIGVAVPAAADECALAIDKTVASGVSLVRFDGITYRIFTDKPIAVAFDRVDNVRVQLTVKPIFVQPTMMCEVAVQWGCFPPLVLSLDGGGGSSFLLNTETGYAEK